MNKHLNLQINDDLLILIAILRQKEFYFRNEIVFDGKSCFSFYSRRVNDKNINLLKEICGINITLTQQELEALDRIKSLAIMNA